MSLGLEQVGQTLAVGAFSLYGVFLIARINPWTDRVVYFISVQVDKTNSPNVAKGAAYLALIIAIGVLVEGMSYNYTANREPQFGSALGVFYDYFLGDDKNFRLHTLIRGARDFDGSMIVGESKGLLVELVDRKALSKFGGRYGSDAEALLAKSVENKNRNIIVKDGDSVRAVTEAIDALYYHAKNTIYKDANYYNELTRIETRITFTRSFTFVCVSMLVVLLVSFFGGISHYAVVRIRRQNFDRWDRVFMKVVLMVLFTILCFFGKWSQESERINYDLRIFGYFSTACLKETAESREGITTNTNDGGSLPDQLGHVEGQFN